MYVCNTDYLNFQTVACMRECIHVCMYVCVHNVCMYVCSVCMNTNEINYSNKTLLSVCMYVCINFFVFFYKLEISGSDDFTMFLWSPQVEKVALTRMVGHQQLINHIAFSPDGRYIASGSFDKKVKLWCGKTGRFLSTCTGHVRKSIHTYTHTYIHTYIFIYSTYIH